MVHSGHAQGVLVLHYLGIQHTSKDNYSSHTTKCNGDALCMDVLSLTTHHPHHDGEYNPNCKNIKHLDSPQLIPIGQSTHPIPPWAR